MAMLQGIQGANNVQEKTFGGNLFAPLPAGGYVCKILAVGVDKTAGGKQFIKLCIDVAEGEHAGFFQKRYQADASSQYGQKWKGVYKIWLPNFTGDNDKYTNAIAMYKGNLNTISRANHLAEPNIEAGFDPDMFKGSIIGVLFREAYYNGNRFTEPAFLCDPQKIRSGDYEIPEPRVPQPEGGAFAGAGTFQGTGNAFAQQSGGVFAAASQQQTAPFGQPFQQPQNAPYSPQQSQPQNYSSQPQTRPQPAQNAPQAYAAPTPAAAPQQQPQLGDLSDFEEVITSDNLPF